MKKLVIVSQAPLTPQIKRNNYIDEYISAGYDLHFWDISQLIHYGMQYVDQLEECYLSRIYSFENLEDLILKNDNKNTIYIIDFDAGWNTIGVFKLFTENSCCIIRIDMYANTSIKLSFYQKFLKLFSNRGCFLIKRKISNTIYKLYSKHKGIKSFDYYITSSNLLHSDCKINHPDYEEFVFGTNTRILDYNYILFVDTYFGYHPDNVYIHKYKEKTSVNNYFKSLDLYFQFLEKKFNMPVVIALHPKADYKNNEFNGRLCIKYKTKDLMYYADKVILQLCNTTSWVTLANKEVVFITTDDYDKEGTTKKDLLYIAQLLNKKVHNIENKNCDEIIFEKIDEDSRRNYIYSYLTNKGIENKKNIDILSDFYNGILIK